MGRIRQSYEVAFKLKVIQYAEDNACTNRQTAKYFGLNERQVRSWKMAKSSLTGVKKSRKRLDPSTPRTGEHVAIEETLMSWLNDVRDSGNTVTGMLVQLQARCLAGEGTKFKASNGWLTRFKRRNALSTRPAMFLNQKRPDDSKEKAQNFHRLIVQLHKDHEYRLCDIYNMDESSLHFDIPSGPTLACAESSTVLEKHGFTAILTVAADGRKLDPYIIYKGKRALKMTVKGAELRVQEKEYVDQENCLDWIQRTFPLLHSHSRLLVWDNHKVHLTSVITNALKSRNIQVAVIPESLTPLLQPLDVILKHPFNIGMCKLWEDWISTTADPTNGGHHCSPTNELLAEWAVQSWADIPSSLVQNSFFVTGISNAVDGVQDHLLWEEATEDQTDNEINIKMDTEDDGELFIPPAFCEDLDTKDFLGFLGKRTEAINSKGYIPTIFNRAELQCGATATSHAPSSEIRHTWLATPTPTPGTIAELLQEELHGATDNIESAIDSCTLPSEPVLSMMDDSLAQINVKPKVNEKRIFDIKTGNRCTACGNRSGYDLTNCIKRSYHSYPLTDPVRLAQWMEAIPRKGWMPTPYSRICSDHFLGGKRSNVEGTDGYIPTIFTAGNQPWEEMTPNPVKLNAGGPVNTTKRIRTEPQSPRTPRNVDQEKQASGIAYNQASSPSGSSSGMLKTSDSEHTTWLVKLKSKNGNVAGPIGGSTSATLDNPNVTPDGSTSSFTSDPQFSLSGGHSNSSNDLKTIAGASPTTGHGIVKRENRHTVMRTTYNGSNPPPARIITNRYVFNQEYLCPVCLQLFGNQPALTVHCQDQHRNHESFACMLCDGVQFGTRSMLLQHNATNHSMERPSTSQFQVSEEKLRVPRQITPVVCDKCGSKYPHVDALASHVKREHKSVKRGHGSATQEPKSIAKREHESPDKQEHKSTAKQKHVLPGTMEYDSPSKQAHVRTKRQHEINPIQEVPKSPSSQERASSPLRRRSPKGTWRMLGQWKTGHWRGTGANKCHLCDYSSITKKAVDEHIYKYHDVLKDGLTGHQCPQCSFKTLCQAKFQRHTVSHKVDDVEKPLGCSECPRRFAKKEHLKRHMMQHNGETPPKGTVKKVPWTEEENRYLRTKFNGYLTGKIKSVYNRDLYKAVEEKLTSRRIAVVRSKLNNMVRHNLKNVP